MSQPEFSAAFRGSPMQRAKLRGLRRNASVVLGNVRSSEDVPVLVDALSDEEPLVRGHAAWALAQIGCPAGLEPLRARGQTTPAAGQGRCSAAGRPTTGADQAWSVLQAARPSGPNSAFVSSSWGIGKFTSVPYSPPR